MLEQLKVVTIVLLLLIGRFNKCCRLILLIEGREKSMENHEKVTHELTDEELMELAGGFMIAPIIRAGITLLYGVTLAYGIKYKNISSGNWLA